MKKILSLLILCPLLLKGQIQSHNYLFADSTSYKNFNQGYIDASTHFNGTGDFLIGFFSIGAYYAPAAICYAVPPKDSRLVDPNNPNNVNLYNNADYYNGYKYGAKKKKRRRLVEGAVSSTATSAILAILLLSFLFP